MISPIGAILYAGTNMGEWTEKISELENDIDLHLFEPAPDIYQGLLRRLTEQIKMGHLFLNNCAIGQKEELRPVYTTTLDKYCNRLNIKHISFLKIDVKGAELDVLRGAKGLFEEDRIDYVQFEYSGTYIEAGITLRQVFELLTRYGYIVFKVVPNGLEYMKQFLPTFEDFNYSNFLAVHGRLRSIFLKKAPEMLDLKHLCEEHAVIPRGVIHIGAHEGKEIEKYLEMGVEKVLFVEANPAVYERLQKNISGFPNVRAVNCAISNKTGLATLHVTSMDQSSSILPLKHHKDLYPDVKETHQVTVTSKTLDVLLKELNLSPSEFNILNIDIQGAELLALQGASDTLRYIEAINTEVNYEELYEGCALVHQIDEFLEKAGFERIATTTPCHPSWGDAFYARKPVITMSTLGINGRFANQIFQYAFLKFYGKQHGFLVETPEWIGKYLFGCDDPLVSRQLPVMRERSHDLSDAIVSNAKRPFKNVDFHGYFQYDTSFYAPCKDYFRSLFKPVPEIEGKLKDAYNALRSMGKTIVGLHLRRSDYGYGYFFIAPNQWYKDWLKGLWDTLDDPVLFIASDELDESARGFAEYNPVTSKDLGVTLDGAEFYPDFYFLSQCDVLAISNSSYSFATAMLNERAVFFFRPHLPTKKLIPFDPWNSEPILRDAKVEDYPLIEINGELSTPHTQAAENRFSIERRDSSDRSDHLDSGHRLQHPQINVMLFSSEEREAYRPVLFSPREIFCGPDLETTMDGQRYRTIKTPTGAYDIRPIVEQIPSSRTPDLIVVKADATGHNFPVNLRLFKCPKLLILHNTHCLKNPIQSLLKYALQEKFDFIMADHHRHHLHYFREAGFENVFWLPGFNINPYEQPLYEDKPYKISFVGEAETWHTYRNHVLQFLNSNGVPINHFKVPKWEAAAIYAQSLINLNISLNGELNSSIFEVLSSGGFLMIDKLSIESGLEFFFKDGEHLVCFENDRDLHGKMQYFVKYPDEAKQIARNGYEEYQKNHRPGKKIKELTDYIFKGELNPLYAIQKEKRSVYIRSESSIELSKRIRLYEFFQELHLNNTAPLILFWPCVDGRLVCDVVDLPRLRLFIKNDDNQVPEESLRLFQNAELEERLNLIAEQELQQINAFWDVAVLTASEVLSMGVENLLSSLNLKWLVISDGLDSLQEEQRQKIKETLISAGFEKRPEDLDAYYWKDKTLWGEILFSANKITEAVRCFEQVLSEYPSHLNALNNLGAISYQLDQMEAAEKFLFKAVSLDRRNLDALVNLSHVYLKMERFGDAAELLQESISLDRDNPSLWFHLGFCYEQLNRTPEALKAYRCCNELSGDELPVAEKIERLEHNARQKS
ncbi:MAG: FkbM family methyltransferase [Pseudomonadota bacterium]